MHELHQQINNEIEGEEISDNIRNYYRIVLW